MTILDYIGLGVVFLFVAFCIVLCVIAIVASMGGASYGEIGDPYRNNPNLEKDLRRLREIAQLDRADRMNKADK